MNLPRELLTFELKQLDPQQRRAVYRFLWRVFIMGWIFWAMGAFTAIGFPGFVRAAEVAEIRQQLAQLKTNSDISARINLSQEIRTWQRTLCTAQDKSPIERQIERLQGEYQAIVGIRYPDYPCPQ
jgi:hypothetical protein